MPDVCSLLFLFDRVVANSTRCVAVKTLPLNTDVEIECIAAL